MHDIPFDVLVALGSLVYAVGLFTDNLIGKQWSSALKQLKTWVIGVLAVILAAHVQYTTGWTVGGIAFHDLSGWSLVLLGMTGSAFSNTIFHLGQRIDQSGSGDTPDMPVKSSAPKLVRNHRTTTKTTKGDG